MSLTSALNIAQSALANTAAQSAILSKNIANVGNADYSRLSASTISQVYGGVTQGETQRATSTALLASLLSAQSGAASQSALSDGLDSLASTLGLDTTSSTSSTTATDTSPATLLGTFTTALQQYAAQPDSDALASGAVQAAKALVANLNTAAANVTSVRAQADSDMAASVKTINTLLAQFKTANDAVVAGTATGSDVTNAADTRDGILKQLSSEIGISTTQNSNGGMSIYTDSGATLFETSPRTVSFTPTNTYTAGTQGQAVIVDGIPVTGASAVMPISGGKLAGLAALRDVTSVSYGNQLDQIAGGLVTAFKESDTTGGSAPDLAGLFTNAGSSTLPTSTTGLAASLAVNSRVDPSAGGVATRLRDGNVSSDNAAYTSNTTGAASYSDRLDALASALGGQSSFNATTGGAASGSLADYASSSVSWISAQRQAASGQVTSTSALAASATTALSNATGVNLDDQLSSMLDIEHAYQASAQLMKTVSDMYSSLIQAFN